MSYKHGFMLVLSIVIWSVNVTHKHGSTWHGNNSERKGSSLLDMDTFLTVKMPTLGKIILKIHFRLHIFLILGGGVHLNLLKNLKSR